MLGVSPLGRYALGQFPGDRIIAAAAGLAAGSSSPSGAGAANFAAAGNSAGSSTVTSAATAIFSGVGNAAGSGNAAAIGNTVTPGTGRADGISNAAAIGNTVTPSAGRAGGLGYAIGATVTFQSNTEIFCVHWEDRGMSARAEDRTLTIDPAA
jgi:hypothetical protein